MGLLVNVEHVDVVSASSRHNEEVRTFATIAISSKITNVCFDLPLFAYMESAIIS